MSAINKIMQPFQFKSSSTQTHSDQKVVTIGGHDISVFILNENKSVTRRVGGTTLSVSHRIRTGKTAKDKANGHIAYKKNRRVWDDEDHKWYKQ